MLPCNAKLPVGAITRREWVIEPHARHHAITEWRVSRAGHAVFEAFSLDVAIREIDRHDSARAPILTHGMVPA